VSTQVKVFGFLASLGIAEVCTYLNSFAYSWSCEVKMVAGEASSAWIRHPTLKEQVVVRSDVDGGGGLGKRGYWWHVMDIRPCI